MMYGLAAAIILLASFSIYHLSVHGSEQPSDGAGDHRITPPIFCQSNSDFVKGWVCSNDTCQRKSVPCSANRGSLMSLDVCQLVCGLYGTLWPIPTGQVQISKTVVPIDPDETTFETGISEDIKKNSAAYAKLREMTVIGLEKYFVSCLHGITRYKYNGKPNRKLCIKLNILHNVIAFTQDVDESYSLSLEVANEADIVIKITAETYFGARHGIETLSQLVVFDEFGQNMVIPSSVNIVQDKPKYPYRGVVVDTSRNFYPISSIKKILSGMAMNKLNTFHWHITDTHSFPLQLKKYPQITKLGAYSSGQIYTEKDIKEVVEYARTLGIRVIPEFDAPAHVGEGWQYFELLDRANFEKYLVCFGKQPWGEYCQEPPCGQLNPTSEEVYSVLADIYEEMFQLFPDSDMFHMGGDEVNFNCWKSVPSIMQWMNQRNMTDSDEDLMRLWNIFQSKASEKLKEATKGKQKFVLWTSGLTDWTAAENDIQPDKYIIQIWTLGNDEAIARLANRGFQLIFSNYDALYMDCGAGSWIKEGLNWCSYFNWRQVYNNRPAKLLRDFGKNITFPNAHELILGAESAIWSEQIDEHSVHKQLWPRTSAMAEVLWSDPTDGWKQAENRFYANRQRMVNYGIPADSVIPAWCVQNPGECA